MRHERHPLSAIFGDMSEAALLALSEDIKQKGVLDPVVLYDGQVLDGWHRCMAAQMAGVEIPYTEYAGDDPGGFVISKNLHRRQRPLTASQRAALVLEIHEWRPAGRPAGKTSVPVRSFSNRELAAEAEVSEKTIEQAKVAHRAGMGEKVANGSMSAKAAAQKAREANGAPPAQKPTEIERLKSALADADEELQDLREKNHELADALQATLDAEGDEKATRVKFDQLYERIRALESQVREHQHRANQFMRECKALRKKLGIKP